MALPLRTTASHRVPGSSGHRLIAALRSRGLSWLLLALLLLHFRQALGWLVQSWQDATYESWGFLALLLLVPLVLRPPPRRERPSLVHLLGVGLCLAGDLLTAPLRLNVLSALFALVALHLFWVAHRAVRGRWFFRPELLFALLSLPAVYWANVLFGFSLQQGVSRAAAAGLGLYGLPAAVQGTLITLPGGLTAAVDQSCSGLKLLYSGVLLGIVLAGSLPGLGRKALFWAAHLGLLLGANVMRVISLCLYQLHAGSPAEGALHQGIGLAAFALCCGASLLLGRVLGAAPPSPRPGPTPAPVSTVAEVCR